jgi:tRNA acetyltransferase TAN1
MQYAQALYGLADEEEAEEDEADEDIEAAVKKELEAIKVKGGSSASNLFTPIKMGKICLIFVKTKPPVDPVHLVRRICQDATKPKEQGKVRTRYINRFTPVELVGKSTEQGIVELARKVLSPWFDLSGTREKVETVVSESEKVLPTTADGVQTAADQTPVNGNKLDNLHSVEATPPAEARPSYSVSSCTFISETICLQSKSSPYDPISGITARWTATCLSTWWLGL